MKILHLASGNRWTGAAAPAFAEVDALRAANVDAHYAYVGGYKLQAKIQHHDFAHPLIEKAQNPVAFLRSTSQLDRLVRRHGFDVIHAHLTYDHWLARLLARDYSNLRLARTVHARRVLRNDPLTRSLFGHTSLLFAINESLVGHPVFRGREVTFTPPPVDHRQFSPDGESIDASPDKPLVTVIGKLSKGRGFEEALQTFAILRKGIDSRMMIIGHGEHRPALEETARELGVADAVIWAGYHEDDLPEHYRASALLLFTARGSDEGHRAILEALACGVPVATYPLEGVRALVEDEMISPEMTPESLAVTAQSLLRHERNPLRRSAYARSLQFGYAPAAQRLMKAYEALLERDSRPSPPV